VEKRKTSDCTGGITLKTPGIVLVSIVLAGAMTIGCGSDSTDETAAFPDTTTSLDSTAPPDDAETDPSDSADDSGSSDVAPDVQVPDAGPQSGEPSLDYRTNAPGPFQAGYKTIKHSYKTPGLEEGREILVHVWYPTEATTGDNPLYEGLFLDDQSFVDAPAAAPVAAAGYPVHVHSHGHRGFGGSSANLMRFFASHGWVAIAPDHSGNTLTNNIEPRPTAMFLWRSMDITEALNLADNLPVGDELAGKLRTDAVVMSGHSFGVHTCWASSGATFDPKLIEQGCADKTALPQGCTDAEVAAFNAGVGDKRIVANIAMAGSMKRDLFGPMGHQSVSIPMLSMSGSDDPVGAETQYQDTKDIALTWIDLAGGCHQTFGLGDCKTLDPELGFAIVNEYALAFARRYVLSDPDSNTAGIVDGTVTVSDLVTFLN
jgi:predicted dienelactone hydrolase